MKAVVLFLVVALVSTSFHGAVSQMKWCTMSVGEEQKCVQMRTAFDTQNLSPAVVCVAGDSVDDCMIKIHEGRADLVTLDGGYVYTAGKEYSLKPVIQETYEQDTYFAVAVVRATSTDLRLSNLEGKKSCHTGVRRTAGWNVPVGYLLEEGYMQPTDCGDDINAVANFFNQSCAPGAYSATNDPFGENPANLCGICMDKSCPSATETYASYAGAFRCLAEGAGDVAFIKPATVTDNTDGNGQATWNQNLMSADFRLLCPDGTQAMISEAATCNMAKSPAHAVVTSAAKSTADIQTFQDVLQQAVTLFGDDNNQNGFLMFDSSAFNGDDLLFKDTTVSLTNLAVDSTYETYLGAYAKTIEGLKMCPPGSLRWCTISDQETRKCRAMSTAFKGANLTPEISCYQESSKGLCIDRIYSGDADVVTLDGGDLYVGGRQEKIATVAGENYNIEDSNDASYWAVAVARAGTMFGIDDLAQRQSCHTGIGKTSGWNVPVGHLIKQGHITVDDGCDVPKAVGAFFSGGSCAPGAKTSKYDPLGTNPSSLCQQCIGTGTENCVRNSAEPYYDYSGAFRCLAESAGDVAFVKHTTVMENTDGNGGQSWSANLRSGDYELLCPDNSRMTVARWKECNLAKVPSHAVVTSSKKTAAERREIWTLLNNGQMEFGADTGNKFKLFDSDEFGGSNLLFKDSTVNLVDVGDKDTAEKWLSEEYAEDLDALYCESVGAAPKMVQASLGTLVLALLVQAIWTWSGK